jgi:hypothetical protein
LSVREGPTVRVQNLNSTINPNQCQRVFNSVLHLCLKKKAPTWLLKNSRPVILEPYLRRLESSVVFRRMQRHMELTGGLPSCMLAYRRQLAPQQAAILGRMLILLWTAAGEEVHVAAWDEENAFCNVPRTTAHDVIGPGAPGLAAWLQQFYGALPAYVVTPHGLSGPYQLHHGGAQGDSMGVGWYLFVAMRRTEFHLGLLRSELQPADLVPGGPSSKAVCFTSPHDDAYLVPELGYSDDRRFFARSSDGLATVLEVAAHGC